MGTKRLFIVKEIDKRFRRVTELNQPIALGGGALLAVNQHEIDGPEHLGMEGFLGALRWKDPVRVATTAAGTLASSFENGDTIDGAVLATGDRILVKDQAAGAENGIYTVNATGAPTRAVDFDESDEVLGAVVAVLQGTVNADDIYICTTNSPITIGTTALAFALVNAAGSALVVQEDDVNVDTAVTTIDFTTALSVTSSPSGEANVAVDLGSGAAQAAAGNHGHTATGQLTLIIGDNTNVVTIGVKGYVSFPFAATITGWRIMGDASGTVQIDVWKDTYANFPPTVADTIAGSEKPALSSQQKNEDTSLSTWTTSVTAGDVLGFNVDTSPAPATVKQVTLELKYTRTL
jgi:phage-related tail fiber protein